MWGSQSVPSAPSPHPGAGADTKQFHECTDVLCSVLRKSRSCGQIFNPHIDFFKEGISIFGTNMSQNKTQVKLRTYKGKHDCNINNSCFGFLKNHSIQLFHKVCNLSQTLKLDMIVCEFTQKNTMFVRPHNLLTCADSSTDTTVGWTKNIRKPNFFEKVKKSSKTQKLKNV